MTKKTHGTSRDRNRRLAAAVAGVLAALMILSTILGAIASASADSSTKISGLKDQLSQVNKRKKTAQQELDRLKNQKNSILAEIEQIDAEIDAATEEIDLQQQLIAELDAQITVKEAELAESQKKEDEQYAKLKERVRLMYEKGSMSSLSILLSSDDFSDFLTRYEIVSQMSKYDKNLFEQLKQLKQQIAEQKESLEVDRADAVTVKAELETNKRTLEQRMNARSAQMKQIETAEGEVKTQYAAIAEEEDKISKQIKQALAEQAASSSSTYVGGSFMWPLPAANNIVTCKYGMRTHPITGVYKLHTGVDLRATSGTKIYAANSGTVTTATYSSAYGYYVVINHGGGVATLYAHMSKLAVSKGQKVSQGTIVGYVGSTGYSTAPHLHFEILKNGQYTDPLKSFPNFSVVYK